MPTNHHQQEGGARKGALPADIVVFHHGSVVQLFPVTDAGRDWMREKVEAESWQYIGNSLCVDPRFANPVIEGAMADGLEVRS